MQDAPAGPAAHAARLGCWDRSSCGGQTPPPVCLVFPSSSVPWAAPHTAGSPAEDGAFTCCPLFAKSVSWLIYSVSESPAAAAPGVGQADSCQGSLLPRVLPALVTSEPAGLLRSPFTERRPEPAGVPDQAFAGQSGSLAREWDTDPARLPAHGRAPGEMSWVGHSGSEGAGIHGTKLHQS